MRSPSLRQHLGAALCAVLSVAAVAGCGDDDPAASEPPTTTAPATASSTTLSPEEEDERALRQLAEDWFEAVRRIFVDGEDPAIAEQYLTGDYLEGFRQHVEEDAAAGHVTERDPEGRTRTVVENVSVNGDRAVIEECAVNADVLLDASGIVIDDTVGMRRYSTVAVQVTGEWRLSQRTSTTIEESDAPCPD